MWAILILSNPLLLLPTDRVDVVEHNTVMEGEHVRLEQLIFWRYDHEWNRWSVVDWRRVRPEMRLSRDMVWIDSGIPRRVISGGVMRTVTDYDRECRDRSYLPIDCRPLLRK